nr:MAG TPA: hypothetical protein [Caudoviricetes sp.]
MEIYETNITTHNRRERLMDTIVKNYLKTMRI